MADETATPAPDETPVATEAPAPASEAPASDTAATGGDPGAAAVDADDEPLPDLSSLSKDERRKYSAELAKLDPAARKTFNALLTQKSQAAASERKRLGAWAEVADLWQRDPEAALKALQERVPKKAAPVPLNVPPEVLEAVSARLDEASKPLAPVIAPVALALLESELAPIRQFIEGKQQEARVAEAQTELVEFEKARPDYKQFEAKMVEWGQRVPVGPGMTPRDYLDVLYRLASADAKVAQATTARASEVLEKVKKAAANAEPDTPSVSPASVHVRRQPTSVAEAWEQAKQELNVQS